MSTVYLLDKTVLDNIYTYAQQRFIEALNSCIYGKIETAKMQLGPLLANVDMTEFDRQDSMLVYKLPPLALAIDAHNWELCDWLLECGADPSNCLVHSAITNNREAIDYLRKHHADFEAKKHSMFVWAAIEGHTDLAEELLGEGADIHHCPPGHKWSDYALFHAAVTGMTDLVIWLLERGAVAGPNREKILEVTEKRGLADVRALFVAVA